MNASDVLFHLQTCVNNLTVELWELSQGHNGLTLSVGRLAERLDRIERILSRADTVRSEGKAQSGHYCLDPRDCNQPVLGNCEGCPHTGAYD